MKTILKWPVSNEYYTLCQTVQTASAMTKTNIKYYEHQVLQEKKVKQSNSKVPTLQTSFKLQTLSTIFWAQSKQPQRP